MFTRTACQPRHHVIRSPLASSPQHSSRLRGSIRTLVSPPVPSAPVPLGTDADGMCRFGNRMCIYFKHPRCGCLFFFYLFHKLYRRCPQRQYKVEVDKRKTIEQIKRETFTQLYIVLSYFRPLYQYKLRRLSET